MRRGIVIAVIVFSLLIPVLTISCDGTQLPEGEAVIGPEGGTLEIDDENHPLCGFKIEFPEAALNSSTTIQVRPVDDTGELPPYVESYCSPFEVLPSGLVFNEPVILTIPFDFGALTTTDFVYVILFDETNNEWDRCGVISYNYTESTVTVETIHFSEGAVAKSTVDFSQSVYTDPAFDYSIDRYPDYQMPEEGGWCAGISVFTTWYFKEIRQTDGYHLNEHYCEEYAIADLLAEEAQDILDKDYGWHFLVPGQDRGYVAKSLWLGLKNEGVPQLLNIRSGVFSFHMVMVYKYENSHFYIQNPNLVHRPNERIEVKNQRLEDYDFVGEIYNSFRFKPFKSSSNTEMQQVYNENPPNDSDGDGIGDACDEVIFPDPNLEAEIRNFIFKPDGSIYQSDLLGLTWLTVQQRNIADLTGLEHCTSLTRLNANYNQITDVSPLANLTNLGRLWLGGNQISDVLPLASLTNLTDLKLYQNPISNISPLANLTNLTHLLLSDNQISDISPLANLTNLTWLKLQGNQISDVLPLANLTNLTDLYLVINQISDISILSNLTNLTLLGLSFNQISDVLPLASLTNLTKLYLADNQISDISILSNLTNLTWLNLQDNQISDISALIDNPGLGEEDGVQLTDNPLSSDSINIYIPQLEARGVTVYY